jgi:hypothetical protein
MSKPTFSVTDQLHSFEGKAAWVFLPIPFDDVPPVFPRGWGSIPVVATIGQTTWRTALFPLKKTGYFLPVKKSVLRSENLSVGIITKVIYMAAI